jgi:hypothetical protein
MDNIIISFISSFRLFSFWNSAVGRTVEYTRATGPVEKHMDTAKRFVRMVRFAMMENGRMTNQFVIHSYILSEVCPPKSNGSVSNCSSN